MTKEPITHLFDEEHMLEILKYMFVLGYGNGVIDSYVRDFKDDITLNKQAETYAYAKMHIELWSENKLKQE